MEPFQPEVEGYMPGLGSEDKPFFGTIVNESDLSSYGIGTIVFFRRDMYSNVSINGKMYNLLNQRDIIGKVKKPD